MSVYVFEPFPDDDIDEFVNSWVGAKVATGYARLSPSDNGGKPLAIPSDSKLYVVCHGVRLRPEVSGDGKYYDADKFAKLLRGWGLPRTFKDLRMFSCYSGLGTFTPTLTEDQIVKVNARYEGIRQKGSYVTPTRRHADWADAYKQIMKKELMAPALHDSGNKAQNLPFVAYLASALKTKGYSSIIVTGYHGAAWMSYEKGKHVMQTPSGKHDARAKENRERWSDDMTREVWNGVKWS